MMDAKEKTFWMVHGDGPTNYRHPDLESAEREAERLARANPGAEFFVLQAIAKYRKVDVERVSLGRDGIGDDIPF